MNSRTAFIFLIQFISCMGVLLKDIRMPNRQITLRHESKKRFTAAPSTSLGTEGKGHWIPVQGPAAD